MKFAVGDLIRLTDNNRSLGIITDAKEDYVFYPRTKMLLYTVVWLVAEEGYLADGNGWQCTEEQLESI